MKRLYYTLFLLLSLNGFSQTLTPEFEFQLYFEDAVGNKDTVTLGYDPLATDSIDTDFGEEDITDIPWKNNAFEIRITNNFPFFLGEYVPINLETKKQILRRNCGNSWIYWPYIYLDVKNTVFPIKMTFDDTVFQNSCVAGTIFNDYDPTGAWDIGIYNRPIKNMNGASLDKSYLSYTDNMNDTIYSYWIRFGDSSLLTSTMELPVFLMQMDLYPNPFIDYFEISSQITEEKISIYDLQGRKVNFYQEGNKVFPLNCNAGIYLLSIEENGKIYNTKIIKQ